jgi:hypothetical protein
VLQLKTQGVFHARLRKKAAYFALVSDARDMSQVGCPLVGDNDERARRMWAEAPEMSSEPLPSFRSRLARIYSVQFQPRIISLRPIKVVPPFLLQRPTVRR